MVVNFEKNKQPFFILKQIYKKRIPTG